MDSKIPEMPESRSGYYDYYNKCFSVFSKAVDDKNEELINSLIRIKGIVTQTQMLSDDYVTLLHVVAKRGSVQTAIQLCELGAGVNIKNSKGETPIFHAVKNSTEMVKFLINNGANVHITNEKGVSPLQEALLSGSEESVGLIIKKALLEIQGKGNTPQDTISYGNSTAKFQNSEELMEVLLMHKRKFNLKATDYTLLILFAAKIGDVAIFKLVLNKCRKYLDTGKKVTRSARPPEELNFQGYFNRTALHYAVREELPEVVRFLLKEGADVNCSTYGEYTPLDYASCLGNEEICEILLSFGAKANAKPSRVVDSEDLSLLISGDGYYYDEFEQISMDEYYNSDSS